MSQPLRRSVRTGYVHLTAVYSTHTHTWVGAVVYHHSCEGVGRFARLAIAEHCMYDRSIAGLGHVSSNVPLAVI